MARKIELTEEQTTKIKLENEKKRRALFDLHSNSVNSNGIPDNTIEKIASKLELLNATNKTTPKNNDKLIDDTDKLSVSENNNTDKMTGYIYRNIPDKLSGTDNSSVTDKKTVTDKISEPIINLTDKMTVSKNIL